MTTLNVKDPENPNSPIINNLKFIAWGMRFKVPAEHSIDGKVPNVEI